MNHKNSVNFQEVALDVIVSSVAGLQSIKNELILQMLRLQLPSTHRPMAADSSAP